MKNASRGGDLNSTAESNSRPAFGKPLCDEFEEIDIEPQVYSEACVPLRVQPRVSQRLREGFISRITERAFRELVKAQGDRPCRSYKGEGDQGITPNIAQELLSIKRFPVQLGGSIDDFIAERRNVVMGLKNDFSKAEKARLSGYLSEAVKVLLKHCRRQFCTLGFSWQKAYACKILEVLHKEGHSNAATKMYKSLRCARVNTSAQRRKWLQDQGILYSTDHRAGERSLNVRLIPKGISTDHLRLAKRQIRAVKTWISKNVQDPDKDVKPAEEFAKRLERSVGATIKASRRLAERARGRGKKFLETAAIDHAAAVADSNAREKRQQKNKNFSAKNKRSDATSIAQIGSHGTKKGTAYIRQNRGFCCGLIVFAFTLYITFHLLIFILCFLTGTNLWNGRSTFQAGVSYNDVHVSGTINFRNAKYWALNSMADGIGLILDALSKLQSVFYLNAANYSPKFSQLGSSHGEVTEGDDMPPRRRKGNNNNNSNDGNRTSNAPGKNQVVMNDALLEQKCAQVVQLQDEIKRRDEKPPLEAVPQPVKLVRQVNSSGSEMIREYEWLTYSDDPGDCLNPADYERLQFLLGQNHDVRGLSHLMSDRLHPDMCRCGLRSVKRHELKIVNGAEYHVFSHDIRCECGLDLPTTNMPIDVYLFRLSVNAGPELATLDDHRVYPQQLPEYPVVANPRPSTTSQELFRFQSCWLPDEYATFRPPLELPYYFCKYEWKNILCCLRVFLYYLIALFSYNMLVLGIDVTDCMNVELRRVAECVVFYLNRGSGGAFFVHLFFLFYTIYWIDRWRIQNPLAIRLITHYPAYLFSMTLHDVILDRKPHHLYDAAVIFRKFLDCKYDWVFAFDEEEMQCNVRAARIYTRAPRSFDLTSLLGNYCMTGLNSPADVRASVRTSMLSLGRERAVNLDPYCRTTQMGPAQDVYTAMYANQYFNNTVSRPAFRVPLG